MSIPRWTAAAGFVLLANAALAAAPPTPMPMTPQTPAPAPAVAEKAPPASEEARRINAADARKALANNEAVLVDVRPKESYDAEHAQGALLIPLNDVSARAGELPKDKLIITYCT
jgi:3-mercaptopyruvate sulfurtransferase SseA